MAILGISGVVFGVLARVPGNADGDDVLEEGPIPGVQSRASLKPIEEAIPEASHQHPIPGVQSRASLKRDGDGFIRLSTCTRFPAYKAGPH